MSEDVDRNGAGETEMSVNARMDENAGRPVDDETVECPFCGSTNTHVENARGPSLCRTIYHCDDCESPFERFG